MLYSVSGTKIGFEKNQDEALERELRKRGIADQIVSRRIVSAAVDGLRAVESAFTEPTGEAASGQTESLP